MLIGNLLGAWFNSAFGEEVIWRGFVLIRLAQVLGAGQGAWTLSLLASATLFGLLHIYQGPAGVLATGFVGLLFGVAFLLLRRNLWILIFAHGLNHLIAFGAMYLGLL